MIVTSELNNIRITARKMRLISPLLKNMKASDALVKLRFTPKDAAKVFAQVIKTAQADAGHNYKLDTEKLIIKEVLVSDGPMLKRFRPRSRGMAHPILKRTSHLKVVLEG